MDTIFNSPQLQLGDGRIYTYLWLQPNLYTKVLSIKFKRLLQLQPFSMNVENFVHDIDKNKHDIMFPVVSKGSTTGNVSLSKATVSMKTYFTLYCPSNQRTIIGQQTKNLDFEFFFQESQHNPKPLNASLTGSRSQKCSN